MQRLGGWYGFVTWHGEIALMSHDVFLWENKREKQKFNLGLRQKCAKSFTRVNRGIFDVKAEFFKLVPGTKMEQIRNDLDKEYRCLKFRKCQIRDLK